MSLNFFQKQMSDWRIFACAIGVFLPLSIPSEARAARLANVTFTPDLLLVENQVGTVRAIVDANVDPNSGSVTIETNNPFLYYNPTVVPDPARDFPCGIGTPGESAGVRTGTIFNFGNRAQCTGGEGFYGFFYEARVTNNEGSFPSPPAYEPLPPAYGRVVRLNTGSLAFNPITVGGVASSDKALDGLTLSSDVAPKKVPEGGGIIGLSFLSLTALGLKLKPRHRRNTCVQTS